jgi:hypothetical protein
MMVPPAAVGAVIVAVVKRTAPWLNPVAPTAATVREMRFELRIVEEALAGRRVASAHRVRQLGFDETTKFQDPSMVTSVLVEPTPGATPEVVILRAAYATGGGTSAHLVAAIEDKCFARLREFMEGWEKTCKQGSLPEKQGGGRVTPLVFVLRPRGAQDRSPSTDIPGWESHQHHTLYWDEQSNSARRPHNQVKSASAVWSSAHIRGTNSYTRPRPN